MHRIGTEVAGVDNSLIDSLLEAIGNQSHPSRLIETHISWILLTDEFAYKIKKPVSLGFLDFSTLDKRKHYCEEEIRLNKPWAPDIYIDVVPISLHDGRPRIGGVGEPVEFAVRMKKFDDDLRLDRQLALGFLSAGDMRELASNIVARHAASAPVAETERSRVLRLTEEFMWDNFAELDGKLDSANLQSLRQWTEAELERTSALLAERFDTGFVRDCHGDLHLGNLVRLPSGITTFDCIEFSTDLRHIDVQCDIAFLIMDLVARQRHDLAAHFLNRFLELSGDYGGVSVLSLFFVYRCLVRSKVAVIRGDSSNDHERKSAAFDEAGFYADMAMRQKGRRQPILIVMSGLSGSGKTVVSGELMALLPAIRVRSDIERKRMFGLDERDDSDSGVGAGIYTVKANAAVYALLHGYAKNMLDSGHHVILDAAYLSAADRDAAAAVAVKAGCPVVFVEVNAPLPVLEKRIVDRARQARDASEARLEILRHQLASAEPLSRAECGQTVRCDTLDGVNHPALVEEIRRTAARQLPSVATSNPGAADARR